MKRLIITFFLTVILFVNVQAKALTSKKGPLKKDGHFSTCLPMQNCECPPIGCFPGGSQCAPTTTCWCPCGGLAFGRSVKLLSDSEILQLATDFANERILEGTTDEENFDELVEFTIRVIKSAK